MDGLILAVLFAIGVVCLLVFLSQVPLLWLALVAKLREWRQS